MGKDGEATRGRILEAVRRRPGIHKSELSRELNLGWGTISHHVHVLRRQRLLDTDRRGRQLLLYACGIPEEERRWLRALGDDLAAQMLAVLSDGDEAGVSEMSRRLGATPKTVRRRLALLREEGLVERPQEGGAFRLREAGTEYVQHLRPDAVPLGDIVEPTLTERPMAPPGDLPQAPGPGAGLDRARPSL